MKNDFKKIKKEKISDLIVEQFNQMITDGTFKPGDKLPSERELVEIFGVSRASVREAMVSLQSKGIVDIRGGEGTFLNDDSTIIRDHFKIKFLLNQYKVEELIEARLLLETQIVKLAIDNINHKSMEDIEMCYLSMIKSKNQMDKFVEEDFKFHISVANATKNSYLAEMLKTTRELLYEVNKLVVLKPGQLNRVLDSHYKIMEAIKQGDKVAASLEMKNHIKSINDSENVVIS
jgi:GntR family transcriptional repressor for pyruvate dehydrogenase complex